MRKAPNQSGFTVIPAEVGKFLRVGAHFADPMAAAAATDRVVHRSVILEFDVPSRRTDAAQQCGQLEEAGRQN